jgi:hypothetical protein
MDQVTFLLESGIPEQVQNITNVFLTKQLQRLESN